MEREMEWNAEVTKIHHRHYVRNTRAITVVWFVFSICYTILNVVAFIQPFWFGDTNESPGVGYFGLYEWCERIQGAEYRCYGDFLDFNSIQNDYFRASSFLVGGAALLFIFSIICMILFMFLKARIVLRICGCQQLIAAIFMAVACIVYPNAFDDDNVRRICGQEAQAYSMDKCQIRWGYILAIVLIFDALILGILAYVLAARQARLTPEFKKLKEVKEEHMRYIHEWRGNLMQHLKSLFIQTSRQNGGYKIMAGRILLKQGVSSNIITSDRSHINSRFSGNISRFTPPSRLQQLTLEEPIIRHRHQFAGLESSYTQSHNYEALETSTPINFEPLVIPLDNYTDSQPSSRNISPRKNFETFPQRHDLPREAIVIASPPREGTVITSSPRESTIITSSPRDSTVITSSPRESTVIASINAQLSRSSDDDSRSRSPDSINTGPPESLPESGLDDFELVASIQSDTDADLRAREINVHQDLNLSGTVESVGPFESVGPLEDEHVRL